MKSSTYLIRLTRLLILGAVVAGTTASFAGAYNSRPPDVRDAADAITGTYLGSPPDVRDAAAAMHSTLQGLKADGLRLQGIAQMYQQIRPVAVPDAFERYAAAHPYGVGLSSATQATLVGRPPDVRDTAASLAAGELRTPAETMASHFRHEDTLYRSASGLQSAATSSQSGTSSSFNWSDWGVGIGTGIGFVLLLAGGLAGVRQLRHPAQA